MSKKALKIISDAMKELGLKYGFMEYKVKKGEKLPETYFVGEYQESAPVNEDGMQESTFIITGFSRGTWLALEDAKEAISNYFNPICGKVVIDEDGSAVAIFYANVQGFPPGMLN